jgi:putative membrane protein
MFLASVVLALSGRKYLRAAATQGTTPLLAVVLGLLGLLLG